MKDTQKDERQMTSAEIQRELLLFAPSVAECQIFNDDDEEMSMREKFNNLNENSNDFLGENLDDEIDELIRIGYFDNDCMLTVKGQEYINKLQKAEKDNSIAAKAQNTAKDIITGVAVGVITDILKGGN